MRPFLRTLGKAYDKLVLMMAVASAAIIAALVMLICVDVLTRNLSLGTIPWTNEVSEYALYALTLLGAPWVLSIGGHVCMDLLSARASGRLKRPLGVMTALTGAAICVTIAWYGTAATLAAAARGSLVLKTLVFPEWILLAAVPAVTAVMAVGFLREAAVVGGGDDSGPSGTRQGL